MFSCYRKSAGLRRLDIGQSVVVNVEDFISK